MVIATSTLSAEQIGSYLQAALESDVLAVEISYGTATITLEPAALPRAARLCKSDPRLAFDFFDFMSGVDLRDEGFAVVTSLYSVRHRHRVHLRAVAPGGREDPRLPTLSDIYRGANWHEREAYDMFGITFEGHPGLLPRILTVENFEGWPLRKEFLLASREAKPWPGAKEPEERHAEEPAAAEAPQQEAVEAPPAREDVDYDQAVFEQLLAEGKSERVARARAKAVAMRQRIASQPSQSEGAAAAQERSAAGDPAPSSPEGAADIATEDMADPSIAKDAAAGAVGGDVAAGAPGDEPGSDQPEPDDEEEAHVGSGAPPVAGGTPGIEAEGRHTGAAPGEDEDGGGTP